MPNISKYSYEIYNRDLTPYELKNLGDIAVWNEYIRHKDNPSNNEALQVLLRRHDEMLHYVAYKNHYKSYYNSDKADKLQHARYGAICAYNKFNLQTAIDSGTRLTTYVQNVVTNYLLSADDEDSFIVCPPHRRVIRSYLNGKYDGQVKHKKEVESKLGLRNADDIIELNQKFQQLNARFVNSGLMHYNSGDNFDENYSCNEALISKEVDIVKSLYLESFLEKLKPTQRKILMMCSEDYSLKEISSALGLEEREVRTQLQTSRRILSKYNKEMTLT